MSARTMKSSILRSSQNIVMIAMHCRCLDHLCAERPSALSRARSAAQPRSCEAADALSCEDIPLAAPADRLAMRGDRGVSGASSRNKRSSVGVVSYVERLVASSLVACTWEQRTTIGQQQLIVPDACVDLIWAGDRLSIAGPDTQPRVVTLAPGERLVGARLRPGTAGAVLGVPASELCDVSPDAADVLGRDVAAALLEALAAGSDPLELLLRAAQLRGVGAPDPLVRVAVFALARQAALRRA